MYVCVYVHMYVYYEILMYDVPMYVCMYVFDLYVCIHVCAFRYKCMYLFMCAYMDVYHVHMCVYD